MEKGVKGRSRDLCFDYVLSFEVISVESKDITIKGVSFV